MTFFFQNNLVCRRFSFSFRGYFPGSICVFSIRINRWIPELHIGHQVISKMSRPARVPLVAGELRWDGRDSEDTKYPKLNSGL